jgi:hypothetical protein
MTVDPRPSAAVPADQDAFCIHCQYNLRGVAEPRCPECGKPFDPAALATSLIPWVHRKGIGRLRAFWRTVWQVTVAPRRLLLPEVARQISFRDGRNFRWFTLGFLLVCLYLIAGAAALFLLHEKALTDWTPYLLGFGPLVLTAAAAIWTGTACWFAMPKRLDSTRRQRCAALLEYTIAPAAFLPLPALLVAAGQVIEVSPYAISTPLFFAVAGLLTGLLLLLWYINTLSIISHLTEWTAGGKFGIGLTLAILSPLVAILAVGLPTLAVFYWLIMYYSLSV